MEAGEVEEAAHVDARLVGIRRRLSLPSRLWLGRARADHLPGAFEMSSPDRSFASAPRSHSRLLRAARTTRTESSSRSISVSRKEDLTRSQPTQGCERDQSRLCAPPTLGTPLRRRRGRRADARRAQRLSGPADRAAAPEDVAARSGSPGQPIRPSAARPSEPSRRTGPGRGPSRCHSCRAFPRRRLRPAPSCGARAPRAWRRPRVRTSPRSPSAPPAPG